MVPGVLIMTTYKLLLIPHKLARRGNSSAQGAAAGLDERYFPFGHLPKEYVQVRKETLVSRGCGEVRVSAATNRTQRGLWLVLFFSLALALSIL